MERIIKELNKLLNKRKNEKEMEKYIDLAIKNIKKYKEGKNNG